MDNKSYVTSVTPTYVAPVAVAPVVVTPAPQSSSALVIIIFIFMLALVGLIIWIIIIMIPKNSVGLYGQCSHQQDCSTGLVCGRSIVGAVSPTGTVCLGGIAQPCTIDSECAAPFVCQENESQNRVCMARSPTGTTLSTTSFASTSFASTSFGVTPLVFNTQPITQPVLQPVTSIQALQPRYQSAPIQYQPVQYQPVQSLQFQPQVTQPQVTQPYVSQPYVLQPYVSQPYISQPQVYQNHLNNYNANKIQLSPLMDHDKKKLTRYL